MAWPPHVVTAGKDAETIQRELQAALDAAVALAQKTAAS